MTKRSSGWRRLYDIVGLRPATIVMYHSVNPRTELRPDSVSPETFACQLSLIRERYRIVRLRDLPGAMNDEDPRRPVAITFDDALMDFWEYGYPVLKALKVPATMFVPTDWVGIPNVMNAQQIQTIHDEGLVDIGAHTVTHANMRSLDETAMRYEAIESRRRLEAIVASPVRLFAYPFGQRHHFSRASGRVLAEAGYDLAVTSCWGTLQRTNRPFELRRIDFRDADAESTIAAKIEGRYDWKIAVETVGFAARVLRLRAA